MKGGEQERTYSEFVMVFVTDGIVRTKLDEVVGLEGYYVREEIAARKSEVLDNEIKVLICILDARNRHVADLIWGHVQARLTRSKSN